MVLSLTQYLIFFILLSISTYLMYQYVTTKNERSIFRLKLQKEINERKNRLIQKELETDLQIQINLSGIPYVNAFHIQLTRFLIALYILVYYLLIPLITKTQLSGTTVFIFILFVVFTESRFKHSLINILLNSLIKRKNRSKTIEIFILFDLLKSELSTLKQEQEVNLYNVLQSILPLFDQIRPTLIKFLSLWKTSPNDAREVFSRELGGGNARVLADILYKLDTVSKKEALDLISSESGVFSTQHYQKELQRSNKSTTVYFGFFFVSNLIIIVWFIVFIFNMFQDRIGSTNMFL